MTNHFRLKALSCCIGAALGSLTTTGAGADSAVGVGATLGNALNPGQLTTVPARDPDGIDALSHQRSPTGLLYGFPREPRAPSKTASGWTYSGQAEFGGIGLYGDGNSSLFPSYKNLDTGLYLNNFSFQANQPDSGYFMESYGGAFGYRDQFVGAKGGRHNDWKVNLFYDETPHVFTTNYRSLWSNVGDEYLRLEEGLTPGGSPVTLPPNATAAQITAGINAAATVTANNAANILAAMEGGELSIVRRKGGVDVEKFINDSWRFYGSYNLEKREGERPFGAVFGGAGGGGNLEIPETIDYDTYEVVTGLRFDDGVNNLNLQAQVSMFRNNTGTMTFENPLTITPNTIAGLLPSAFTTGTFDLAPDNDYYNVRAEYARSMPEFYKARFTALASFSSMRQNDDLVAPTSSSLAGGTINGVPTANVWNTTDALWRDSAEAQPF